jgi:hypothetical protein
MAFATWLANVGATPTRDQLEVSDPRYTCQMVDEDMLFTTPPGSPGGKTKHQHWISIRWLSRDRQTRQPRRAAGAKMS